MDGIVYLSPNYSLLRSTNAETKVACNALGEKVSVIDRNGAYEDVVGVMRTGPSLSSRRGRKTDRSRYPEEGF